MIRIGQDTLYSRKDLEDMLQGARLDHDTFIGRLKPRKVFRAFYLGSDILEALRAAPALREDEPLPAEAPKPANSGNRTRRVNIAVPSTKLIGGIFRPEDIGIGSK